MATEVRSDVTGAVWLVLVQPGAAVAEGEELLVIESMKMEIPVAAPRAGTVLELRVAEGQQVAERDVLVVLE